MSKRLQVLLPDEEMKAIQEAAQLENMPVGQWVRKSLREIREQQPLKSKEFKLAAIRKAVELSLAPSCDIEQMLAEIEQGYLDGFRRFEYPDVPDGKSAPEESGDSVPLG